jgi:5-methylcytosine-specific restriction endonuclease McrA
MNKPPEEKQKESGRLRMAKWRKEHPERARAINAASYLANKDKVNAATIARRKANPEQAKKSAAAYHLKNKEKINARSAAWSTANKDRVKASAAARYAANPEKVGASAAAWQKANPEKALAANLAWQKANPEKVRAAAKRWYYANKEKVLAANAAWYKANPLASRRLRHSKRARKKANGGKLSPGIALKLFSLQRGKCAICKKSLRKTGFHLDHVIPLSRGGANIDRNIQLTCPTCNIKKGSKDPIAFMQSRGFLL